MGGNVVQSTAQRSATFKTNHSEDVCLNVRISTEAKEQFDRLTKRYRTTQRAMFERLVMQGVVGNFNGADRARELLKQYEGNRKAATKACLDELQREFPGFTTKSTNPEHAEGKKRYRAVVSAIDRHAKAETESS